VPQKKSADKGREVLVGAKRDVLLIRSGGNGKSLYEVVTTATVMPFLKIES